MHLNSRALRLAEEIEQDLDHLRVDRVTSSEGTRIFDFGVNVEGGLRAGVKLAQLCLADLADVRIVPSKTHPLSGPAIAVHTDHPLRACMASQYAGWQINHDGFFAMGSGPMRAAAGTEQLIREVALSENADAALGTLESAKLPHDSVCHSIASDCGLTPPDLTLCVAPTASTAGTIQVVARSIETAIHKLHELAFDVRTISSGYGVAPLPPTANDDLVGIGRTNDAILYGGEVTLWVNSDDDVLADIVRKVPSCASRDFGVPFLETFNSYGGDFYKIDPLLFSPATICLVNLASGRSFFAGDVKTDLLRKSFC